MIGRMLRGKASIAAIGMVSVVVLIAAVSLGLQLPGLRFLRPFPHAARLDYSAGPPGGFAPLDPRLVAELLAHEPGGATPSDTGTAGPGARRNGEPPLPSPVVISHAFTNDNFASAYRLPSIPFTGKTNTRSATSEPSEPKSCSALGGKTAWYEFTATRDVGLLADTFGSSSATALTVFTGTSLDDLTRVGECSSDARGNALVAFAATAGRGYYFQIDGPTGGDLVFTLQQQGVTTRASVGSDGREGDGDSLTGTLSADGRYVVMASGSSNFDDRRGCVPVPGAVAPCGKLGAYLRDRVGHRTSNLYPEQGVAVGSDAASIAVPGSASADGRYIGLWGTVELRTPNTRRPTSPYRSEVFRRDTRTGVLEQVSRPCSACGQDTDGSSGRAELSADGRYVAFTSWAENLVPDDNNKARDVFVRDLQSHITAQVDVPSDTERDVLGPPRYDRNDTSVPGNQGADVLSISANGRFVAFLSSAENLVRHDHNGFTDVFVRDLVGRTTTRVNVSSTGQEANAESKSVLGFGIRAISDDGRYVFFSSAATNLVSPPTASGVENVYRRDLALGITILVTVSSTGEPANQGVGTVDLRRAAFTTVAPFVIAGGPNSTVSPLSYSATPDGRFVVFNSDATNLVPGDTNNLTDIFLHDTVTGTTTRVSVSSAGNEASGRDAGCGSPTISADARFVAFDCEASNLVDGDSNRSNDVFVRELPGPRRPSGWS